MTPHLPTPENPIDLPISTDQLIVHILVNWVVVVVVVILFPTEYKQWRTEQMSNITTTINIDDPVGGHQRSQRLIGLATKNWITDYLCFPISSQMVYILNFIWAKALQVLAIPLMSVEIWNDFFSQTG